VVLEAFQPPHAPTVVAWVTSVEEARDWCGHAGPDRALLESWHRDPDVHPHVLTRDGALVAYGEIWIDREEREVELARLVVAPPERNRGVGRVLVEELVRRARPFGFAHAYVRVRPRNAAAIACYEHAGFARVAPAEENRFNRGQPAAYAWLRRELAD